MAIGVYNYLEFQSIVEIPQEYQRKTFDQLGFSIPDGKHMIIPHGWTIKNINGIVSLLDQKGRKRGRLHTYEANGMQKTLIELIPRYGTTILYSKNHIQMYAGIVDNADGSILHIVWKGDRGHFDPTRLSRMMEEYLNRKHSRWKNVCAYWNQE